MRAELGLAAIGMTALISGCASGPPEVELPYELPAGFAADREGSPAPEACADPGLPDLGPLTARLLADNPGLKAALARLDRAEAVAEQAGARRWPRLDASVQGTRGTAALGPALAAAGATAGPIEFYQGGLAASWEFDLFGRLDALADAAAYEAAATAAERDALTVTLAANLASTWAEVIARRRQEDLLAAQADASVRFLELTTLRFGQGQAPARDVGRQRQQLESLRGDLAVVRGQRLAAENRLSVLIGQPPGALELPPAREYPPAPGRPDPGLPADVLLERPDVRAAWLALAASDARLAAAMADRLPTLTLSGNLTSVSQSLGELFSDLLWSLGGSLSVTAFDAGLEAAEVRAAAGTREERLHAYAETLLTAVEEVDSALARERALTRLGESLDAQLAEAERVLRLARTAYQQGAADYLEVLTALLSVQSLEQRRVDNRLNRLTERVNLCRALGLGPGLAPAESGA
jgi:NodT family efflux transporter outer membrane factor (OMF) lipoprotein